jgi:Ca2+-binding RTX toxin-like protein
MSGSHRTGNNRHFRHRFWWRAFHRAVALSAMLFVVAEIAAVAVSVVRPSRAEAAQAPSGQGFTVTPGDLSFIMKQIKIAEHHAATLTPDNPCGTLVGSGPDQIPDRLTSYGLRTVDGSCNNLFPGREGFAAADRMFPRLATPNFRTAEGVPAGFFGPGSPAIASSSYADKNSDVFDRQPRIISNLIVDQTSTNPAAVAAARFPVRTQGNEGIEPCTTDPDPNATPPVDGVPAGCVPSHKTLFIPNVTTDVGLSPPYNSIFTFFGQFFDHGVDQTVKSGANVYVPLRDDDPLVTLGPDGKPNTGDEVPPSRRFMVLTRAQNQPGPDGILGNSDDEQNATNTDTPWVDQSQTYTSHPSHQAFLREYVMNAQNHPVDTGKLLGDPSRASISPGDTGMATWRSVKEQAKTKLGLLLADKDALNIPMLAVDPYGNFEPGPNGLPQYVTKTGKVEGNLTTPVPVPANVIHFDTPFLTDIAHNADPSPQDTDHNPGTPKVDPTPDANTTIETDFTQQAPGTYDDELLDTHFVAGDGRVNENIALTAVHQVFHSEHDRLVDYIKGVLTADAANTASGAAALADWKLTSGADGWNGQRLFQAARFVTEMEYQHLVFEEFARKVQPAVRPFHVYHSDINAAIPAEFAHAVYRFGHSMLDDDVARVTTDPTTGAKSDNSVSLLNGFLNPPQYFAATPGQSANDTAAPKYTPEQAAGAIFMGSSDQVGNELDEFVTETLRNNLLGLPLDLPTINMARAREAGVPPLNELRKKIYAETNDSQLAPYTDWSDYGQHLKHPESLINFVAAYGKHPTITGATTLAAKRDAARAIVDPLPTDTPPSDAADFMFSNGAWAPDANGRLTTGLDDVDLWVGGLAEVTNLFGGLLGSTFNYVFQNTLENLQDGDRLYYLNRTPGMNLRTQLEGNSFSELVQRNTDGTNSLKADPFATADCKFQLSNLNGTPAGFTASGSTVADDPSTECNETLLLLRKPDGTIQYRTRNTVDPTGINGQAVYNGTSGADRILGGNDNDTFWGGPGNDVIDGQGGDDVPLGGDGNDIITDLDGADVLKGGDGNDALDGGPGDDIILGGDGNDVSNGGSFDNETFGGPGNDFMNLGQGADAGFGDSGDDWMQGGSGQDLIQGDHSAPFFDDPAEAAPGNDVMVGQVGENDYDAEGGDDLMAQNSAIDRNAGAGGWDWAFHQYDTVGGDDDLEINQQLAGVPIQVVVNRDRWQETEADSGSPFNDIIKGDDVVPRTGGGAGFSGCDALDQAGLDRISGLDPLVPPLTGDAADVAALSASGRCPLTGPVWGDGNILLGGGGGDTIEGRGGDDIIDGDLALHVRISVRTNPANPATEIGSTDLLEHPAVTGNFGAGTTGMTLQQAVFAGKVDPGNMVIVREIVPEPSTGAALDSAVFSGPRADYDITPNLNTTKMTIVHARGAATDGTDIVTHVERLVFSDQSITIAPVAALSPNRTFAARQINTTSAAQTVTLSNTGNTPLSIASIALTGSNPGDFAISANACGATLAAGASCNISVTFRPTAAGARSAILRATDDSNGVAGSTQDVTLSGTGTVGPPPNNPATGRPVINDATPQVLQTLSASTAGIADLDGLGTFHFQWAQTAVTGVGAFTNIAGATNPTFTVPIAGVGRRFHVTVTFTDGAGNAESVVSADTARATLLNNGTGGPTAAAAPSATPLGQALAPRTPLTPPLQSSALSVSGSTRSPLTVTTTVPAGANTVSIAVFRLNKVAKHASRSEKRAAKLHIATVFRNTSKAKRYVFRLTEKPLRNLKPGRYLVEVRVGASARTLGPATRRAVTIRRGRAKIAR